MRNFPPVRVLALAVLLPALPEAARSCTMPLSPERRGQLARIEARLGVTARLLNVCGDPPATFIWQGKPVGGIDEINDPENDDFFRRLESFRPGDLPAVADALERYRADNRELRENYGISNVGDVHSGEERLTAEGQLVYISMEHCFPGGVEDADVGTVRVPISGLEGAVFHPGARLYAEGDFLSAIRRRADLKSRIHGIARDNLSSGPRGEMCAPNRRQWEASRAL